MKIKKLTLPQKKSLSEFFNNMAVATLTTGAVIPIFSKNQELYNLTLSIILGVSFSCGFLASSLIMLHRRKRK